MSDSESTIEYTTSQQIERLKDLEQENEAKDATEIVTIDDELDENTRGANTPDKVTENNDHKEEVVVKDNTERRTEIDDLEEVIEQEEVIEDKNNPQRGRILTRSSSMSRQPPPTGGPMSP